MIATRTSGSGNDRENTLPTVAIRNPAAAQADTASPDAATDTADTREQKASGPTRISMLGSVGATESYPVRIKLAKPNTQGTTQPTARRAAQSYPLRIPLGQNSSSE